MVAAHKEQAPALIARRQRDIHRAVKPPNKGPRNMIESTTNGRELLATVSYIYLGFVRWRGWSSDARLVNSAELIAWLMDHGWRAPER